jgi:MFS family permease
MDSNPFGPTSPEPSRARPPYLATRLSVQMFLAFAVQGAWVPVFSVILDELHFSPIAASWAWATYSLSSFVTPLVWGQVADRWVPAERCISLCAVIDVLVLATMATLRSPIAMFAACILFWFFMIPINSLGTALTLRQLHHPERSFGRVRLWGTVGWMVACLLLSLWLGAIKPLLLEPSEEPRLVDGFWLAALFALLVAVYSLTLPSTPPTPTAVTTEMPSASLHRLQRLFDAPLSAMRLCRRRVFLTFCICLFGFYLTYPFTTQMTPLLLAALGVQRDMLPGVTTIGQTTEIAMLALLPWLLRRFGTRITMIAGAVTWTIGMSALAVGRPLGLVIAALTTQGVFIGCFLVAGQMFVNRQSTRDVRASAQGLVVLISGAGLLAGHLSVGLVRQWTQEDYPLAFLPAACVSVVLVGVFLAGTVTARGVAVQEDSLVSPREIP